MENTVPMRIIARIRTHFPTKFGVPRQSGLVKNLPAKIVFEPEFRNPDSLRGLDGFSHLWIIWQFSENIREGFSPTVRPPRLGGNTRMGVFATRSPFRPNPIGLSCVEIIRIDLHTKDGPVIYVEGADMTDNTPIYDIKPYLAFTDSHENAKGGFTQKTAKAFLNVDFPPELLKRIDPALRSALINVLASDPRPGYQSDENRVYKMPFSGAEVHFTVSADTLYVTNVICT